MGWKYDGLFEREFDPAQMDLADWSRMERSEFPVGKMGYRRRTTVSGPRIDAEVFPVFGRQMRGALRKAKSQMTREAQKKANDARSRLRLIQLVEANFTKEDISIGLDYAGKKPSIEQVDRDLKTFFEKVRRRRRKYGLPELKYIAAIGGDEMPSKGYSGTRPHAHVIMNGGIDRDELEKMWKHGRANCDRLQPRDEGLGGISVYFTKQMQDRPPKKGVKKYRTSKNLIHPEPKGRDVKIANSRVRRIAYDFENQAKNVMEKLYPGYVLQQCSVRYSDVVAGVYIRCVLRKMTGGGCS